MIDEIKQLIKTIRINVKWAIIYWKIGDTNSSRELIDEIMDEFKKIYKWYQT